MKSARLGGALVLCLSFPSSDARALPGVRIKSLNAIGVDGEPTTAMDMARGTCETDGSVPEPFTDDKMSATVLNGSSRTLVVKRASIRVERRPGEPRYRVPRYPPVGRLEIGPGEENEFVFLMFDASQGGKVLPGGGPVVREYGFRSVRVLIEAVDSFGKRYTLRARTELSFDNFDNCDE